MNIKILKLNVIIFPMDIHSSNSAFRDYVLNYPCAPCRRFKLPFKVPVSYHSWTRMEPSPVRPRRQKDYACSHPIHRDMHVYLLHTTSSHSLLILSSPYCELFMSAWHRLHDVDVELNAAPWFPSFLLFPPPSAAKDARLLAAYRSLIHSRMKIIPPPLLPSSLPGHVSFSHHGCFLIRELSFLPFVVESTRKFLRERDHEMRCWKMSKPFETKLFKGMYCIVICSRVKK